MDHTEMFKYLMDVHIDEISNIAENCIMMKTINGECEPYLNKARFKDLLRKKDLLDSEE